MEKLVDVIHVGFPKTGTTWLQENLLAADDRIACLGKPYHYGMVFRDLLLEISSEDEFSFSASDFHDKFLETLKKKATELSKKQVRIISYELLTGDVYSGNGAKEILDRLSKVFGKARILITIRDQVSLIESLYRFYIRAGGSLHIREFLYKRSSPAVGQFGNQRIFERYNFDRYIAYCIKVFGKSNVKVIPFEMLRDKPSEFAQSVLAFLGLPANQSIAKNMPGKNPSFSHAGLQLQRIINQLVATPHSDSPLFRPLYFKYRSLRSQLYEPIDRSFLSLFSGKKKFVDVSKYFLNEKLAMRFRKELRKADEKSSIRQDIQKRFAESNQKTSELIGIDLSQFGYSM